MFKIRQRNCFLITIMIFLISCGIIIIKMGPGFSIYSNEQYLIQRLAECNIRLQYLESLYRSRMEDVEILSQYLNLSQNPAITSIFPQSLGNGTKHLHNNSNASSPNNNILESLSWETRHMLMKGATRSSAQRFITSSSIRLPNAYQFLPHLLNDSNSLVPAYIQDSKDRRTDVNIVLGIPTVQRTKQSYLLSTLQNLLNNMNDEEKNETLIIVFIGETDLNIVYSIAKEIQLHFELYIDCGLIDIIAPSPSYYPNFEQLRITLSDSLERVKWRSKQNLDFAYLMTYAQTKGTFYVQLEDDIMAKKNFITSMKKFAMNKSSISRFSDENWIVLDFCQLGFIGKMFKSIELPYLITFFHMFYNDKPVDWLLTYFIETKVCRIDKDQRQCNQEKAKYWLHYRPSLFQHIGTRSSLKGKIQKLKDKQFGGKVPTFYSHTNNPPAIVRSNIAPYKNYILKRAYNGETFFWGLSPQAGDKIEFIFKKPTLLKSYLFRTGNSEHPSDRFYNTTVEILTVKSLNMTIINLYNYTINDGYLVLGKFDSMGVAAGSINNKIGEVKEIRLYVHSESENWVLLSEIDLQVAQNKTELVKE